MQGHHTVYSDAPVSDEGALGVPKLVDCPGSSAPVRVAVFPAAGFGTRMLPASKAIPKEMLTVVDRPLIQYGVEEAAASGIERVVLVTASGKASIEDHFDASRDLEALLQAKGNSSGLAAIQRAASLVRVASVRQARALGLGHAVLLAESLVGGEPFAVFLPDDIMDGGNDPVMSQLIRVHARYGCSVIAVERVPDDETNRYGIVEIAPVVGAPAGLHRILEMIEKPAPGTAPSNLAIMGRYVLTPAVFAALRATKPGAGGEIQLTDGIRALLATEPILALEYVGRRYDCGSRIGFLRANIELALANPEIGREVRGMVEDALRRTM
jgi:UTP--glucose-1-phosphate uridylyltransferase